MKKITLLVVINCVFILLISCVKQKNCDCGTEGWLVTYEKPIIVSMVSPDTEIYGIFYSDDSTTILFDKSIPKSMRKNDSVRVKIEYKLPEIILGNAVAELTCVELL